ncbi:MAG: putative lipid II flippase FtsW [Anaerolineae bacterium]|nr:putative lipid II flippase FtsW [Anaerolineae bacterium]
MADQPLVEFPPVTADVPAPRPVRATPRSTPQFIPEAVPVERKRSFIATLDGYFLIVVGILLAIGLMMVYSTTFDWSYQQFGSESTIFMQHARNMLIGVALTVLLALIDYRIWRRIAVLILLVTIGALIAVLIFGDDVFNARRALINGSFQPGELAELSIVIYMAAWLSSRRTQIRSITYGLIPFAVLVSIVAVLVLLQPDISTAATIIVVAGIMFFLAGADLIQMAVAGAIVGLVGVIWLTNLGPDYAQGRLDSFVSGSSDITQADYHVQQAIIAFSNGGLTGAGLGQGKQKFANLPAPHTDSIFAVIGEELGLVGASVVVALYVALVFRGFQVARRSVDNFGSLLAAGLTIWIAIKALLNIAVMTALVPPTGASLPFISFGGSSLVVVMCGVGLLLSISRVKVLQGIPKRTTPISVRRVTGANNDRGGRHRRTRLSSDSNSRSHDQAVPGG